ncbi:MAG: methyltransferase domain-containing protein [Anaerolineaceae bacterium]|nr:methyltransferase domain-containing protein [Anaerolineaceae bacterium]
MNMNEKKTEKVISFYNNFNEQDRLSNNLGQIEFIRTQSIIQRYLKTKSAVVLDIGGAAGRYACWLAQEGHIVHLVDPVPKHIDQAKIASGEQTETPIASIQVGDARHLDFADEIADAVLLLGPLYHLVDYKDRFQALSEVLRVLKPGGLLFAACITRFASMTDGLISGRSLDPSFQKIIRRDLSDGQHRNPNDDPSFFTDSFFHHPDELRADVGNAGFEVKDLLAVEGLSFLMKDLKETWKIESQRQFLLKIIEKTEREPSLMGASPHIICVGVKPGE